MLGTFYASYPGPNDTFNQYLYDGLFNNGIYKIGDVSNWAHIKSLTKQAYSFLSKYNTSIFLWGGDPSLEVWTGAILDFSNTIIDCINDSIYIDTEGVLDYTIRVVSEDGRLLEECTSIGSIYSLAASDEPCYLVLDKHNYKPYILYYNPLVSFIQNKIIKQDSYYRGNAIIVGNNVDSTQTQGNVVVKQGTLTFDSSVRTVIQNGFKCEKGARLIIK